MRNRVRRLAPIPVALLLSLSLFAAVSQATVNLSGLVAAPAPANQGGTTQAGAPSTFRIHTNLFSTSDDLRNLTLHLPPGLVGNPNAANRCTVAQFNADSCPASSRVGAASQTAEVSTENPVLGDITVTIDGDVYNVVPAPGQPGRLGIILRPDPLNAPDISIDPDPETGAMEGFGLILVGGTTQTFFPCPQAGAAFTPPMGAIALTNCLFVRANLTVASPRQSLLVPVTIRPGDLGLDNTLANLPRTVDVSITADLTRLCDQIAPPGTCTVFINPPGVTDPDGLPLPDPPFVTTTSEDTLDIKLRSIDTRLFARAPSGEPFITNPTSCGPAITVFEALSYQGDVTAGSAGFTPTGCNLLPFSPNVAMAVAARRLGAGAHPAVTAVVTQNAGEANQKSASVTLPPGLSPDEVLLSQACAEANLQAGTCPPASLIGQAKLTSRLFPVVLTAPIYIVQSTPLPGLAVDLRGAGIPAILRATNELTRDSRLRNVFGPLPDLPLSRFELAFKGGAGGPLVTNERLCRGNRQFNADFLAQSGAQHSVQGAAQFNGRCPPRARPKCGGVRATIIGNGRSNRLIGTNRRDVIVSRRGNDTIRSRGGNDIVCAGPGNDRVFLGKGKDKAFGGAGRDILRGGPGVDVLRGGRGADVLRGGRGNDACFGGRGRDSERSC